MNRNTAGNVLTRQEMLLTVLVELEMKTALRSHDPRKSGISRKDAARR